MQQLDGAGSAFFAHVDGQSYKQHEQVVSALSAYLAVELEQNYRTIIWFSSFGGVNCKILEGMKMQSVGRYYFSSSVFIIILKVTLRERVLIMQMANMRLKSLQKWKASSCKVAYRSCRLVSVPC